MTALLYTLLGLFIFICLVLVLLILIQKGRGGGLASAFGGGGGNTAFGSKTGDVLTWATSVVFGIFLLLAIILNLVANKIHAASTVGRAPVTPAAVNAPVDQGTNTTAPTPIAPVASVESPTTAPSTQPGQ